MANERARPVGAVGRFLRLEPGRRGLLLEAAWALTAAAALLRILPFRRAVRLGSRPLGRSNGGKLSIEAVSWSIEAAAARLPFRLVCFQRGLAMQWMLRRRGVDARLHYGIAFGDDGGLQAHVWVDENSRTLIGGEEAPRFRCVATYPE